MDRGSLHRRLTRTAIAAATAAIASASALAAAPPANAADSVYWASYGAGAVRLGNLDGTGSASSLFSGENAPEGVAIDPAANKIYWADDLAGKVRVANLDGTGTASSLFTGEFGPVGIAINPATNKVYWTTYGGNTIRVGNLDGTGPAATLFMGENAPDGIAINPAANKIYWTNNGGANSVRVGNLDGTGSASTLFASEATPWGVAINPAANRIYWATNGGGAIRVANLDGTGSPSNLYTGEGSPLGPAIDPTANKIYWSSGAAIRVGNLDGSGLASSLFTGENAPFLLALLRAPAGTGAPSISPTGAIGTPLTCGQGTWAPDLLGSFLYRAPHSFAYTWQLGGTDIPSATQSTYTPTAGGSYTCRQTATNRAGSTPQTSTAVTVPAPPPPPPPPTPNSAFTTLSTIFNPKTGAITFTELVSDPGTFGWTLTFQNGKFGVFAATAAAKQKKKPRCKIGQIRLKGKCRPARVVFGTGTMTVAAAGTVSFTVTPSRSASSALKNALKTKRALAVTAALTYQSARGGTPVSHTLPIIDRLKKTKPKHRKK